MSSAENENHSLTGELPGLFNPATATDAYIINPAQEHKVYVHFRCKRNGLFRVEVGVFSKDFVLLKKLVVIRDDSDGTVADSSKRLEIPLDTGRYIIVLVFKETINETDEDEQEFVDTILDLCHEFLPISTKLKLSEFTDPSTVVGCFKNTGCTWSYCDVKYATPHESCDEFCKDYTCRGILFPSPVKQVSIRVKEGQNLAPRDRMFVIGPLTSADPFYEVKYRTITATSATIFNNLKPQWNEKWIDLGRIEADESQLVVITLFDHNNLRKKDFMGTASILASDIYKLPTGITDLTLQLQPSTNERLKHKLVSGEIVVQVKIEEVDETDSGAYALGGANDGQVADLLSKVQV